MGTVTSFGPSGPILQAFERQVAERGGEPALRSRGEGLRLSFREVGRRVAGWSRSLPAATRGPVALAVGNRAAFPELFLALLARKLPVVLLDSGLSEADKVALCRRLGIPSLLHRGGAGEHLGEEVRLAGFTGSGTAPIPPGTVLVKLTSGSTGEPLAPCFTEENLMAGIGQIAAGMGIEEEDTVLLPIPLSHSYGFDNGVLSLAVLGTPLVLEPSIYPARILAALEEKRATVLLLVPPLVRALGRCPWPGDLALRLVISAGGPLQLEAAEEFRQRSGRWVHQFYGCSESGGICFEAAPEEPGAQETVGRPLPGVAVELGPGGAVEVRSPANSVGRLGRDSIARQRAVRPGDTAVWAAGGRLRLTGRTADLLNVGGRKVPAAVVEAALRSLEGVEEAAVVGVEDPVRGDRVVAFVVAPDGRIDPSGLPPRLLPREIRRVAALPFTERGKVDRRRLRELARGEGLATDGS